MCFSFRSHGSLEILRQSHVLPVKGEVRGVRGAGGGRLGRLEGVRGSVEGGVRGGGGG